MDPAFAERYHGYFQENIQEKIAAQQRWHIH